MARVRKFIVGQVVMYGECPIKLQYKLPATGGEIVGRWEATDGRKYLESSLRPLSKIEKGLQP